MNYNSYSDYINGECSLSDFCSQYPNTANRPEVGNIYMQKGGIITEWYKIIFADEKEGVALGVVVKDDNGGLSVGGKCLFYYGGASGGFKYNDVARANYRLQICQAAKGE